MFRLLFAAFFFLSFLHCDELSIRDYLQKRRPVMDKEGVLSISGAIQAEFSRISGAVKQSKHAPTVSNRALYRSSRANSGPFGYNEFNIDVDLMLDYKGQDSWASMHLEYENPAGILSSQASNTISSNALYGSGQGDNLYLIRAYAGKTVYENQKYRLDFELGRRYLSDIFDSRVQFNYEYDGARLHYVSDAVEASLLAFIADYRSHHFAGAGQVEWFNLFDSNFDIKYSLISWEKHGINSYGKKHPLGSQFVNSQGVVVYHFQDRLDGYVGVIKNHKAPKNWRTQYTKQDKAFYIGGRIGDVVKKHDISFDCNYQFVQAQSIPEWDVSGIGRLNTQGLSFYDKPRGGFANYKGVIATLFYGLTDNTSLQIIYQQAVPASKKVGNRYRYSMIDISTIYNF